MSEFDLTELVETFVAEAIEDIAALESGLLALETTPDDADLRRELQRHAHTLKGNASCVGMQAITDFAHSYEELLERITAGEVAVDGPLVNLLLSGIDTFRRLVDERENATLTPSDRALLAALRDGHAAVAVAAADVPTAPRAARVAERSVRVSATKLNRMLDLAGEIAIARGRVRDLIGRMNVDGGLLEVERQVDQLQGELQELIMRARMVPIGPMFRQYERTVRDVAAAHGKNARLLTIGDDVELDTSAVELLREPLTHMIRNAIDHGLETSSVRVANGKSPVGHITLEAQHDAGNVVIRISDDGAGLDREAIAARAGRTVESDADLDRLIFEPGFSTTEEVTELSGRGVGMDVVRRAIEALRGTISIATKRGQGTAFTIRLPLTLAVIDGFGVRAGDETYLVPLDHVVECVELPNANRNDETTGVLLLRDEIVPYVRLRQHFALGGDVPSRENVLIVQINGQHGVVKAGLAVDELHGASQAVIKPLGGYFTAVPGISGSSILGNGRVALILDTPAILRSLEVQKEQS
ncbi:MAG TPA: chemotaxis protein CheA [Thermoanaerobaculia bacterium]|nr:chemotaxis protein CheA [Thermoanaerobaculia bacterium]